MGTRADLNDLEEAVRAARAATDALVKLLALHGITTDALAPGRPAPVREAISSWRERVTDITRVLAEQQRGADAELSARDSAEPAILAYLLAFGFA